MNQYNSILCLSNLYLISVLQSLMFTTPLFELPTSAASSIASRSSATQSCRQDQSSVWTHNLWTPAVFESWDPCLQESLRIVGMRTRLFESCRSRNTGNSIHSSRRWNQTCWSHIHRSWTQSCDCCRCRTHLRMNIDSTTKGSCDQMFERTLWLVISNSQFSIVRRPAQDAPRSLSHVSTKSWTPHRFLPQRLQATATLVSSRAMTMPLSLVSIKTTLSLPT